MWIYIPYYRKICKNSFQNKILDTIEANAETKEVVNRSGKTIVKHKATFRQFNCLNISINYGR
jgi:hypothetical protein